MSLRSGPSPTPSRVRTRSVYARLSRPDVVTGDAEAVEGVDRGRVPDPGAHLGVAQRPEQSGRADRVPERAR